ncbi:MAG: BrnA antitoxin family protein [Spirochaetaceae bacterium]|jgi:uncharacterized protein (DUF4415 family)|nr:BrnA antitoxin family protein [Spirochaetaceae bacterium]
MAETTVILKTGQKPTKEELERAKQEYGEAIKHPPVYDPECPPSSPEALEEFATMARELRKNRRNPSPVVALRISPEVLAKYKALGKGYTGIMADVLRYGADNPEILKAALTINTGP